MLPTAIFIGIMLSNWIASRVHYICLDKDHIYIQSFYTKNKTINGSQFLKIDVFIPGQSYYRLYLKDGRRYTFLKQDYRSIVDYFKKGDRGIVGKMNEEVSYELSGNLPKETNDK